MGTATIPRHCAAEEAWRNFYTEQHKHYCGIDLPARAMYVCILDQAGTVLVHKNLPTTPEALLRVTAPYREDLVVAVECIFTWYWLADRCEREGIAFVLGHALSMKAIHGGKAKNDKIDAHKIAVLLRGGMLPQASVYPAEMRATRDLLRRRCHLVGKRAELLAHMQNTNSQYNLPEIGKQLAYKANREGVEEHFPDPRVRKTLEVEVSLIDHYDQLLGEVELYLTRTAKAHEVQTFARLQSVPGSGQILALVLLYEIQDLTRFPRVQDFVSYCPLVKCAKESGGKRLGTSGKKSGTVHLRWAFAEAAVLFLRHTQPGKEYFTTLEHNHGKAKALTVLAHKLARAVYYRLTREQAFALQRFVTASPLRGGTEPTVSLAHTGQSPLDVPSFYTASTVREHLDTRPGAPGVEWTVSPAHVLGEASPSAPWCCPSAEFDTHEECLTTQPAGIEWTGTRAQQSFSGVTPAGATVSRGT